MQALAFLLAITLGIASGIQFIVPSDGTEKCIVEQFNDDSLVKGEITISPSSEYFNLAVAVSIFVVTLLDR